MTVLADELPAHLPAYLDRQRWFPAKGRPVGSIALAGATPLLDPADGAGGLLLDLCLLRVEFLDAAEPEHFQVLVGRRSEPGPELEHAVIGVVGDRVAYDALWDVEATDLLLAAIREGRSYGEVRFVPEPGVEIATRAAGRVLGVEQSNTSVAFGDASILKLFRRVSPGLNPDLELHRALRSVGSAQVASLQGAIEGVVDGRPATLGMLQDFAANSAEGWAMALTSVRDLFAEGDLFADEVGGDFAGEARRLGETVALVHAELAQALGTGTRDGAELGAALTARLTEAAAQVPELEPHVEGIRAVYDELSGAVPTQRVHGDLHLGQTLRTPYGWLLIDFEGEPSSPLADRTRMDSPLRDVAGMLRSFDYAVYHQVLLGGHVDEAEEQQLHRRADEWAARNRSAFCDGYAAGAGTDPRAQAAVLRAFELDKAVYEVLYETRSRPAWTVIPLTSIARLVEGTAGGADPRAAVHQGPPRPV